MVLTTLDQHSQLNTKEVLLTNSSFHASLTFDGSDHASVINQDNTTSLIISKTPANKIPF